jgi:hypothetical protein
MTANQYWGTVCFGIVVGCLWTLSILATMESGGMVAVSVLVPPAIWLVTYFVQKRMGW